MFIYFERERACKREDTERKGERESQHRAQSHSPSKSWPEPKSRVGCLTYWATQATPFLIALKKSQNGGPWVAQLVMSDFWSHLMSWSHGSWFQALHQALDCWHRVCSVFRLSLSLHPSPTCALSLSKWINFKKKSQNAEVTVSSLKTFWWILKQ